MSKSCPIRSCPPRIYRRPAAYWEEPRPLLSAELRTGKVAGLEVTIFNARLDLGGDQAERLAKVIREVLSTEVR